MHALTSRYIDGATSTVDINGGDGVWTEGVSPTLHVKAIFDKIWSEVVQLKSRWEIGGFKTSKPQNKNTPEFAPSPPVSLIYLKHEKKMDYRSAKNAILFNQFPPLLETIHTPTEIKLHPFSLHFRAPLLPTIPKKSTISAPSQKTTADTKISKNIKKITNKKPTGSPPPTPTPPTSPPPSSTTHKPYPLCWISLLLIIYSQFLSRWSNTQR